MDGDRPIGEMLSEIEAHVERGAFVFLKWTCQKCGERVMANEPNKYCSKGYRHEEKADGSPCGYLYTGTLFGYLLLSGGLEIKDLPSRLEPPQDGVTE